MLPIAAWRCERRDQHRLVLGGGQEQWAVRDKGVGDNADFRLNLSPGQNTRLSKFDYVAVHFGDAVGGRNEVPAAMGRSLKNQPRERTPGTGSRKENAAVEKEL